MKEFPKKEVRKELMSIADEYRTYKINLANSIKKRRRFKLLKTQRQSVSIKKREKFLERRKRYQSVQPGYSLL